MITPTAFAVGVWGAVTLLALVFGHLVHSLTRDAGVSKASRSEVDR